jgi:glutamine synthetase
MMAESLDYVATELEKLGKVNKTQFNEGVQKLLQKIMKEHDAVIFNGDGYSEAWHKEAVKRGLPNLKTTPEALPVLTSKEVVELFTKYGVLSEAELKSRQEIYLEQYVKTVATEANLVIRMARTVIFPAAMRYQGELAQTCANLKAIGHDFKMVTLEDVTAKLRAMQAEVDKLEKLLAHEGGDTLKRHAKYMCAEGAARHAGGARLRRCEENLEAGKRWWLTICGRCPPTRRCCLSAPQARLQHLYHPPLAQ